MIKGGIGMLKVSIIIPVYNVEKYLRKCLNSIYFLDLSDKEVIIINDGSTDSSPDILNEYKNKYPDKTKIISQKNQGQAEARNVGLKSAIGDYILFIDSDDFIDPIETEEFLKFGIEKKVDILIGAYKEYYDDKNIIDRKFYKTNKDIEKEGIFYIENGFKNKCLVLTICEKFFNRKFLLKNNLFFEKGLLHEDVLFTSTAFFYAKKVRCYNKKFYFYRRNNLNSTTNTLSKKNYEHLLYIANKLLDFKNEKELENKYFNRIILGLYASILRKGKYINEDIFYKISKLNFKFKEKLKLIYVFILQKLYHSKLEDLDIINLNEV